MKKLERALVWMSLSATTAACGSNGTTADTGANHDGSVITDATSGNDTGTSTDTGTTTDSATDTGTPTDGAPATFVPSNFTLAAAMAVAAGMTAPDVDTGGSGRCTATTDGSNAGQWDCLTTPPPHATVTLAGASGHATLWILNSLTVDAGDTLDFVGDANPAIVYVMGDVNIGGTITVEAGGLTAGNGVGIDGPPAGGGAGGGSFCGLGGAGSGFTGATTAMGGMAYGMANLVPLQGGSAGGSVDGSLGHAGGALQITASGMINIGTTGKVYAGGLGGDYRTTQNQDGGGGASGGAILLEAPTVTVAGTIVVNGGGGGDSMIQGSDASPANGASAAGGGGNGGQGSAGGTLNGSPGIVGSTMTYGGGGGGAGRIRINTTTGNATFAAGFILSPSMGTACVTQGTL